MDTQTIHHGRNVKRIREMLGIKQDALATSLGLSQQAISQLEQKEVLDKAALQKVSKALGVSEEVIENFNDEAAVNIVANTINNHDQASVINYYPTFNPIDKIVELYDQNIVLYERMLTMEREKNELLQKLLNGKE
jgi:transcriptional regulator with XRE-family HTH domain